MKNASAGEIWRVDVGLAAKVRPALILSDYPADNELALLLIVPHTTSMRGSRWEFPIPKLFLRDGAFHLQQIQSVSLSRFDSKLGDLTADEFRRLKTAVIDVLNLNS
jgi:mRNA interferase MazF